MTKKILLYTTISILGIIVGFFAGYLYVSQKYIKYINAISLVRQNDPTYPYVHPIIGLSTPDASSINELTSLTSQVKQVMANYSDIISRYSVYFRDLDSGKWIGVNENDGYDPASMLKVALAIAAYKQAETDPSFLQSYHEYTPALASIITDVPYSTLSELKVYQSYTIEDLIQKMIVDSDNGAKDILGNTVSPTIMKNVYTDLGIAVPSDSQEYYISARQYTVFLRRLYNASYLNIDYSNRLIALLDKATFESALVAGVPANITVAHKYGEHINSNDNTVTSTELHDCGIVYNPKNPYVLCVMTEGKDESDLATAIAAVSKAVYQEVDSNYK